MSSILAEIGVLLFGLGVFFAGTALLLWSIRNNFQTKRKAVDEEDDLAPAPKASKPGGLASLKK